jgi:hypothetical protein
MKTEERVSLDESVKLFVMTRLGPALRSGPSEHLVIARRSDEAVSIKQRTNL